MPTLTPVEIAAALREYAATSIEDAAFYLRETDRGDGMGAILANQIEAALLILLSSVPDGKQIAGRLFAETGETAIPPQFDEISKPASDREPLEIGGSTGWNSISGPHDRIGGDRSHTTDKTDTSTRIPPAGPLPSTVARMIELHQKGFKPAEISSRVGRRTADVRSILEANGFTPVPDLRRGSRDKSGLKPAETVPLAVVVTPVVTEKPLGSFAPSPAGPLPRTVSPRHGHPGGEDIGPRVDPPPIVIVQKSPSAGAVPLRTSRSLEHEIRAEVGRFHLPSTGSTAMTERIVDAIRAGVVEHYRPLHVHRASLCEKGQAIFDTEVAAIMGGDPPPKVKRAKAVAEPGYTPFKESE